VKVTPKATRAWWASTIGRVRRLEDCGYRTMHRSITELLPFRILGIARPVTAAPAH
jgi:hypothetical protein